MNYQGTYLALFSMGLSAKRDNAQLIPYYFEVVRPRSVGAGGVPTAFYLVEGWFSFAWIKFMLEISAIICLRFCFRPVFQGNVVQCNTVRTSMMYEYDVPGNTQDTGPRGGFS